MYEDSKLDPENVIAPPKKRKSGKELLIDLFWVTTNTVATILVVFVNKM